MIFYFDVSQITVEGMEFNWEVEGSKLKLQQTAEQKMLWHVINNCQVFKDYSLITVKHV